MFRIASLSSMGTNDSPTYIKAGDGHAVPSEDTVQ
jgi:hypothetical protein